MPHFSTLCALGMLAATAVFAGGCGSSASVPPAPPETVDAPPPPAPPAPERSPRPASQAVQQLIEAALQGTRSTSYDAVVRQLGAPQRVTTRTVANAYVDNQVDTVRTLYYPALQARVYTRGSDTGSFLIQLKLLASFYTAPNGLQVQMEQAAVRQQLGAPHRTEGATWVYENLHQGAADLRIAWQAGRIQAITYVFHFS